MSGPEVCPDCWHEDCTGTCETFADRQARLRAETLAAELRKST